MFTQASNRMVCMGVVLPTVFIVVLKSGGGFREALNPTYPSTKTNIMKRNIQRTSGKVGDVLFIIFIHHIVADVETQSFCRITHPYNGLSCLESYAFLLTLSDFSHAFHASPIFANLVCNAMHHDQDEHGIQYGNASERQYTYIHGVSPCIGVRRISF